MDKESIIIVGAGVAGLVTAMELSDRYQVTVLEATNVLGGRIHSIVDFMDYPFEGGAEFVHGDARETLKLLQQAGIGLTDIDGVSYRKHEWGLFRQEEQVEGWEGLLHKMKDLNEDMSFLSFLNLHYLNENDSVLRKEAIAFATGFDLADVEKASTKALYLEWSNQSEDHRVDGGYCRLIDYLAQAISDKGGVIRTQARVKTIDWSAGKVVISTDDLTFEASKCVLTVPLGVLQDPGNYFNPRMYPPVEAQKQAINKLGFGAVVKVILNFKEPFWPADAGFIFSEEEMPTWWTLLPDPGACLIGWCGGLQAKEMFDLEMSEVLQKSLNSLALIFDRSAEELYDQLHSSFIFNWENKSESSGGYSYATLHMEEALQVLNTPLMNTIYYAGEAYYYGPHPGTVEAAIVSAKQTAMKILG